MPYEVAAKNLMLDWLRRIATHASLHSGKPSTGNEVSGGGYERQRVSFTAASHGAVSLAGKQVFGVPGGASVACVGFWTAPSGGVLLAWGPVRQQSFKASGAYVIDSAVLDLNKD